eukprot:TRINITY_DN722_c0_g1_i1.p1 TRINITY_DN722_c0_g1~~TRINITY_DN722_c0_g1_i1.p1  ORF type:complete len:461 (-),score=43.93 TRINITY_DN722_c0_g1_i1:2247-3629(-)
MCSQQHAQLRREPLTANVTTSSQSNAFRTLATNIPGTHTHQHISSSAATNASPPQFSSSTTSRRTTSPSYRACPTSTPSASRSELHQPSLTPTTHNAHADLRLDASVQMGEPLQYHSPQYSHQLTTPSVAHPHTMPPAEHLRYAPRSQPPASVPHPGINASTASHPYRHATTSVPWHAPSSAPSPINSHVLPGPQYMPYVRSATHAPAYYVYPSPPSQYVTHPAYYAPNYTYSTIPQNHPPTLHDRATDPRPPHAFHAPPMTLSPVPVQQSMPAAASQQQPPLMSVPVYVNMPPVPLYSQQLTPKKRRLQWTPELHAKFVRAVNQYGIDEAVPKLLLRAMNVPGLTRENVASHLQKYRENLRKKKQALDSSSDHIATDSSPADSEARGEASREKSSERNCSQGGMKNDSSSRAARCDSSDVSSAENISSDQREEHVRGRDERASLPDQALKKRRCSESPT